MEPLPELADVLAAEARLRGRLVATPLLSVPRLDLLAGASLYLKCENLQHIGAFKARGALNAVLSLTAERRERGLVTFSSGNHGQAVALAARELGVAAQVVMPEDAPLVKVDAVRALGATVVFAGKTTDDRRRVAERIVEETGGAMIPPFDDARVIAGQGTATLELLAQARERGVTLDYIVVPVGGGGLLAGACLAAGSVSPAPRVLAAEPDAANAFALSLVAKQRVVIPSKPTIADGLKPIQVGELTFAIAAPRVAGALTVDDDAIGRAVVELLLAGKVLAEPSGACALAAAISGKLPSDARHVGVVLSGGNIAPATLARLLAQHAGLAPDATA